MENKHLASGEVILWDCIGLKLSVYENAQNCCSISTKCSLLYFYSLVHNNGCKIFIAEKWQ